MNADGFSLLGRYDFLNGTGTSAEVVITASRPLTLTDGGQTASDLAGVFGIDSADFTNLVTNEGGTLPVDGHLDSFTVQTSFQTNQQANAAAIATGAAGDVPVAPNFPNGAFFSTGPEGTADAGLNIIPAADYNLLQVVTIDLSGLLPGESVDILLPEPSLLCAGALMLLTLRRNRSKT